MASIGSVQRSIEHLEGFRVRFRYEGPGPQTGRDVRDDRRHIPPYDYSLGARSAWTVAQWIDGRFKSTYPGFGVDVVLGDGRTANARTQLRTVRASYDD